MMKNIKLAIIFIVMLIILIASISWNDIDKLKPLDVEEHVNKGVDYLVENQNEDGSVSLDDKEVLKVWETANAMIAVHEADKSREEFFTRATDFLLHSKKEDGSFYYMQSFEKKDICIETTSVATLALALREEDVSTSISFLKRKQNPNGSWGVGIPWVNQDIYYPSVTGYALRTLMHRNISDRNISKGIEYIQESQYKDGSWGSSPIYYETPYYATFICLNALEMYENNYDYSYNIAIDFIEEQQNQNGSWDEDSQDDLARPSRALRSALALNSLLISPRKSDPEVVYRGVEWMMKNQKPGGHWEGGHLPDLMTKNESIFATSLAVSALERYKNHITPDDHSGDLQFSTRVIALEQYKDQYN